MFTIYMNKYMFELEYDHEIMETLNKVILFSYDMLKEDDGVIHRRSIIEKLCEAELYYDPPYIYEVFDSVDEIHDGILTLEEFTNFYHVVNNKTSQYGEIICTNDNANQTDSIDSDNNKNCINISDVALGFVIIGVTTAGALFFANKIRR
jgi:hypothetical protein